MKKNILFLLCLFIIPINAITVRENIEQTKFEWNKCNNEWLHLNCNQQKNAYNKAIKELTQSLNPIEEQGKKASEKLRENEFHYVSLHFGTNSYLSEFFHLNKNEKIKLEKQKKLGINAQRLMKRIMYATDNHLANQLTIDEFYTDIIKNLISDLVIQNIIYKNEGDDLTTIFSEILKTESNKESKQK